MCSRSSNPGCFWAQLPTAWLNTVPHHTLALPLCAAFVRGTLSACESLLKGPRWADFPLGILDESSAAFAPSGFGALPPPRLFTRCRHSSRARTYSSLVEGTERENAGWDGPFLLSRFANRSPFMFNPLAALVSISILVLDSIKSHVSAR